jgi:diguanylate cyclase (GGDEF)-like protein
MITSRVKKLTITILLLTGISFCFLPLSFHSIAVPVILSATLIFFLFSFRKKQTPVSHSTPTQSIQAVPAIPQIVSQKVDADTSQMQIFSLGATHRKEEWKAIEKSITRILETMIALIKLKMHTHTVAFFFPTLDHGYRLKAFSSIADCINPDAVLYPGVGIIGGLLKDGLKQLNLPDITNDSTTLYYYTQNVGVQSLIASTIIADNVNRGLIIVDSNNKNNFTEQDHHYLNLVAAITGDAVFSTYMYTEHKLTHVRLAAMSSIEKEFFRHLSFDSILDKMTNVIPFAISCDRLTISFRQEEQDGATIKRIYGDESEIYLSKKFSIKEKTLAGILFSRNIALCRNFSTEHYEYRYFEDEPQIMKFKSFLAVPLGVDECKGMILLESYKYDAFSETCKELLSRLATSAGLALEKTIIFEKAKTLATRDGLTGLRNHREFQQILKDEITRSIRYNDPLSLALCDIDFFKRLNDTYGHQFGDTVLKGIAAQLENSIRDGVDTAARYGGEEFVLILVKNDMNSAAETVERIRQHIANQVFIAPNGEEVHVTMSFGIAEYRQHAKQIDELIKKADKALYRAKENGRNKVEVF